MFKSNNLKRNIDILIDPLEIECWHIYRLTLVLH